MCVVSNTAGDDTLAAAVVIGAEVTAADGDGASRTLELTGSADITLGSGLGAGAIPCQQIETERTSPNR